MRINKRKFFTRIFILISIIGILVYARHLSVNEESREQLLNYWGGVINSFKNTDTYLLSEKMYSIGYDKNVKNTIKGRKNGVLVLNTNGVSEYNIDATTSWQYELPMLNPIIETSGNWAVVAEENGMKLTTFNASEEVYNREIEGPIQKIYINSSGHVGVIFEKIGYKNGFAFINPKGELLYTKYFANTTLVDADIREDGKVVSMIEADTDGVAINFAITFLDDKANTLYSTIKKNTLLVETEFISDNNVIVSDSNILVIDKDYNEKEFEKFEGQEILGICINDDKIIKVYRESSELFANKTNFEVKRVDEKIIGRGEVEGAVQSLEIQNNMLAIVLTDRIDFFTAKGNYSTSVFISGELTNVELFKNGTNACIQTTDGINVYRVK